MIRSDFCHLLFQAPVFRLDFVHQFLINLRRTVGATQSKEAYFPVGLVLEGCKLALLQLHQCTLVFVLGAQLLDSRFLQDRFQCLESTLRLTASLSRFTSDSVKLLSSCTSGADREDKQRPPSEISLRRRRPDFGPLSKIWCALRSRSVMDSRGCARGLASCFRISWHSTSFTASARTASAPTAYDSDEASCIVTHQVGTAAAAPLLPGRRRVRVEKCRCQHD